MFNPRKVAVATMATLILATLATKASVADELEEKLRNVDHLGAGSQTPFDEVDSRCKALLAEYGVIVKVRAAVKKREAEEQTP